MLSKGLASGYMIRLKTDKMIETQDDSLMVQQIYNDVLNSDISGIYEEKTIFNRKPKEDGDFEDRLKISSTYKCAKGKYVNSSCENVTFYML